MILLNFDIEEFDVPVDFGKNIAFEEQIQISKEGTSIILDILKEYNIKATFFCTVTFAQNALDIIKRIVQEGHEVASHGFTHSEFKTSDLLLSKNSLETITGTSVNGFRMARMMHVESVEVFRAGYKYNSSINPTYVPGRYNYFRKARTYFIENDVVQIPASVTPIIRIPLFWLTFHNIPIKLYLWLTKITLKKDKYINVYFHPWEFIDISDKKYGLPVYVANDSGNEMICKFKSYLEELSKCGYNFCTFSNFINCTFK